MKGILLSVLFFAFTTFLNAQKFEWAKRMGETVTGTSHQQEGSSIAVDDSGNVYTTGYFDSSVDFDPGPGTFYLQLCCGNNIFVSKLDASGNLVWAKGIGGSSNDKGTSIALDAFGNVYVTGFFTGSVDFDPGAGNFTLGSVFSSNDVFVLKLNASGNFIWAKSWGSSNNDVSNSIAIDVSGNVYTTGLFSGTADFDPSGGAFNLSSFGSNDIFVSKLDTSGNFIWAKQMGGPRSDVSYSIAVDSFGNAYTTGFFYDSVDFDPGVGVFKVKVAGNGFYPGIFVSKLDSYGNFVWAKQMGGVNNNEGASIAVDNSGNVYTTGYFQGWADFDPGSGTFNLISSSNEDVFVSKLDASGNFLWAKQMGGNSNDHGKSLAIDASGNVYITGFFSGTSDFAPGTETFNLNVAGGWDIFVSKLDASGNFIWAKKMGGASDDVGNAIAVNTNGNIYTTGYFGGMADFDPTSGILNLTASGFRDIFVHKMSWCAVTTSAFSLTACSSYTFPDSNFVWTASGTYIAIVSNSAACDSIITLHLTVNQPSFSTIYNTICNGDQYQFGNSSLTASGTYTDTLQNISGCDSIITLHLTVLPPMDISAGADTAVCHSDTIQLSVGLLHPATCAPYYALTQIPYNAIAPSGTTIAGPAGDDLVTQGITMPFPFQFFCNVVDSYFISTNGFIAFNTRPSSGCCQGQFLPSTVLPNNLVTMIWEDLSTYSGGNINYFVSGNAPNRVLVVRWNNVAYFGGGYVNGEIHLRETTNVIEIHASAATATGQTNTIGIENGTGTIGYSPVGYNADSFTVSTPVAFRFTPQTTANLLTNVHWVPSTGLTNDTILNPKAYIDTTITYTVATAFANGCISHDSITITKTASPQPVSIYDTIYNGQSYQFGNASLTATGIYTDTLQTINGCDSLVFLHLTVKHCQAYYTLYPDTTQPHNWWAVNQATGSGSITYTWYWGDGTNSTGATPSHIYSAAGNYNICLTIADSAGCSDTYCDSSTYIYKAESMVTINVVWQLPTGITELSNNKIRIYPNPATNQLFIETNGTPISEINIYNTTGSLVSQTKQPQSKSIDISQLANGVYIAEIKTKAESVKRRWVKM